MTGQAKDRPAALGRIVVTGAAGLVGQNLIPRLKARGFTEIVAIDKHRANCHVLRELHPEIRLLIADLVHDDGWQMELPGAEALVIGHAQIGGIDEEPFTNNNVRATERLIEAVQHAKIPYLVHISSSAVNSNAVDCYTESKKAQEAIVLDSGVACAVLRPTLMFGWFDRKHLGWLARFMSRAPMFPVPGHGRYRRQPLYAGDLCAIIAACLERRIEGTYNISGLERLDYVDLMRKLRNVLELRTPIVKLPYGLFRALLWAYAIYDQNPPFTVRQLEALVTADDFEIIDWPGIFDVTATPLDLALTETFRHPLYSRIALEF